MKGIKSRIKSLLLKVYGKSLLYHWALLEFGYCGCLLLRCVIFVINLMESKRNKEIAIRVLRGSVYEDVGIEYDISRERVFQIVKRILLRIDFANTQPFDIHALRKDSDRLIHKIRISANHITIKKIISGGQTGADQAGLDVAIKHIISHGGTIPKGRMTEDDILDPKYNLDEMSTQSYPKRTEKNVLDSDGTAILTHGKLTGGSLLTRKKATQHDKPVLHLNMSTLDIDAAVKHLRAFVTGYGIDVLNVAGSRASKDSEIYSKTFAVVEGAIAY